MSNCQGKYEYMKEKYVSTVFKKVYFKHKNIVR